MTGDPLRLRRHRDTAGRWAVIGLAAVTGLVAYWLASGINADNQRHLPQPNPTACTTWGTP